MSWSSIVSAFKTPQGAIAFLAVLVTVLGEVGILSAPLSGALQALLSAILGVLAVVTHTAVQAKVSAKATVAALRRTGPPPS